MRQLSIAVIPLSWPRFFKVPGIGGPVGGPGSAEDIGDLE